MPGEGGRSGTTTVLPMNGLRRPRAVARIGAVALFALLAACTGKQPAASTTSTAADRAVAIGSPAALTVQVVATIPRGERAFTQGLELIDGALYESTGLLGQSGVQELDPQTGAVRRRVNLPHDLFGEGLTGVGSRLYQSTWQNHLVIVYDRRTLTELTRFANPREGWGICFDGTRLILSDGSSRLTFRDPETFAELGGVDVTRSGEAVARLNELECVDGQVYANVWRTSTLVAIDPESGQVTAQIDASSLVPPTATDPNDVLNGIASVGDGKFIVTGKRWPSLFVVTLTRQ